MGSPRALTWRRRPRYACTLPREPIAPTRESVREPRRAPPDRAGVYPARRVRAAGLTAPLPLRRAAAQPRAPDPLGSGTAVGGWIMTYRNDPYDPKQGVLLDQSNLDDAVAQAQKAFTDANDLDALTSVKHHHLGDRSAVSLARREIGA